MQKESPQQPFPPKFTDVFVCEPEWLSKALGVDVSSLEFKPLAPGNTGPTLTRVSMQMKNPEPETSDSVTETTSTTPTTRPFTLVAKYCSAADMKPIPVGQRVFQQMVSFDPEFICEKEVFFYEKLQPQLLQLQQQHQQQSVSLRTPHCYYIAFDQDSAPNVFFSLFDVRSSMRMLLLMADLSPGAVAERIGTLINELAGASALRILARHHASLFHSAASANSSANSSNKQQQPSSNNPVDAARWIIRSIPEKFRHATNLNNVHFPRGAIFRLSAQMIFSGANLRGIPEKWSTHALFGPIFQRDETLFALSLLSKKLILKLEETINNAEYSLFRYQTLLHGDCHMGNSFFPCSKEDFAQGNFDTFSLIDWQMYGLGSPSFEVVYFLAVNVKFNAEHYLALRDEYYLELAVNLGEYQSLYTKEIFDFECDILAIYEIVGLLLFLATSDQSTVDEMMRKGEVERQMAESMASLCENVFQIVAFMLPKLLDRKEFAQFQVEEYEG